ncbi:MAG: sigma-70 family RNA polymerase sigma factor [bacterium]
MTETPGPVTALLARVSAGDDDAMDRLFPLVYQQLRQAAEGVLRSERPGHTLQPTALVHEAYLKLIGSGGIPARDRGHFLSIAARAMRQILVDHARRRRARKRGDGDTPLPLEIPVADGSMPIDELVALDDALEQLSAQSPRLRSVVELRFFGGLSEDQIAETLGVTTRTVQRDWVRARAWLYREVYGDEGEGGVAGGGGTDGGTA